MLLIGRHSSRGGPIPVPKGHKTARNSCPESPIFSHSSKCLNSTNKTKQNKQGQIRVVFKGGFFVVVIVLDHLRNRNKEDRRERMEGNQSQSAKLG